MFIWITWLLYLHLFLYNIQINTNYILLSLTRLYETILPTKLKRVFRISMHELTFDRMKLKKKMNSLSFSRFTCCNCNILSGLFVFIHSNILWYENKVSNCNCWESFAIQYVRLIRANSWSFFAYILNACGNVWRKKILCG